MILCYDSAMLSQIEKSIQYAGEPHRLQRNGKGWILKGNHHEHHIIGNNGNLGCDCSFYEDRGICCHLMTLERLGQIPLTRPATDAPTLYPEPEAQQVNGGALWMTEEVEG